MRLTARCRSRPRRAVSVVRVWRWREQVPARRRRRPVDWGFTDRAAVSARGPYAASTSAATSATTRPRRGQPRPASPTRSGVPRERLALHEPGARRRRRRGRRPLGAATGAGGRRAGHRRTRDLALAVLVADCVPVLLADPAAGVVAAVHAGRPGMTAGIVGRAVAAMRDARRRAPISAAVGPSVCGRCYEVPRRDARATRPRSARRPRRVSWTGTRPSTCGRRGRPAARRSTWPVQLGAGLHARVRRPVLLPPRPADRPLRGRRRLLPGGRERVSDAAARERRHELAARLAQVRGPHRARPAPPPDATPTTSPWSSSRRLPGLRRRAARRPRRRRRRREPRPGGGGQGRRAAPDRSATRCTALHRAAADQQGRLGRRATPTSVHSVDRPKLVAALAAGPHAAGRRARGAGPGQPRRRPPARGGVRPADARARWPTRSRRRGPRPARRHGRGPAGRRPRRAFARLREVAAGIRADAPGGRLDLGRDERRPRGGGAPRRDTPACRHRNPRIAPARLLVTSHAPTDESRRMAGARHGWGAAQDDGVPRARRGGRAPRRVRRLRRRTTRPTATSEPAHDRASERSAAVTPLPQRTPGGRASSATSRSAALNRITTIHPRTYNEAKNIGEAFREGTRSS